MMTVTLLKRFAQAGGAAFNIGERIAVTDALAAYLLDRGVAALASTDPPVTQSYDTPPVHRMIDAAPVKKDINTRKGRFHAE